MRRRTAAVALAAVVVFAGCAPGANDELRALVDEVSLPGASDADCEWGSSGFENDPKSWYGCWKYHAGTLQSTAREVESRLAAHDFVFAVQRKPFAVEITARRGPVTVCVDVLARGFTRGRNTYADEVNMDRGEVFVDVWTTEPRGSAPMACAELPRWPDEQH